MSAFYFDNAITWAQYRLRGGLKNTLIISGGYTVLISGIISVIYGTIDPHDRREAMMAWTMGLLFLECLFLLILGSMRVRATIHADILSGQIESHRLMPLTPGQAIVGYILGANVQFISLAVCTFLIGSVTTTLGSYRFQTWLIANAFLLVFALFLWSMTALTAFAARGFFWLLVIIFIIAIFSRGLVFIWTPAILMLSTPVLGTMLFATHTPPMLINALTFAVVAQLIVSVICICGAARKYDRDDDAISLPAPFTLIALSLWVCLSGFAAMNLPKIVGFRMMREFDQSDVAPMVIGAIATSILFAMAVMSSAAWTHLMNQTVVKDSRTWRMTIPMPLCLLLCVAAVTVLPVLLPANDRTSNARIIAIITALSLWQVYLLMRTFYGWVGYPNLILGLYLVLLWIGPLVADLIYYAYTQPDTQPRMDVFAPMSPVGLLIQLYSIKSANVMLAVITQGVALVLSASLLGQRKRSLARRAKREQMSATPAEAVKTATSDPAPLPEPDIAI